MLLVIQIYYSELYVEREKYINLEMEKNLNKETSVYNGNVISNGFHEADLSSDNELEESLVSDTLVFYVNGKQVCTNITNLILL